MFRKPFGSVFATIRDILGVYTLCKRAFDRGPRGFKCCLLDVSVRGVTCEVSAVCEWGRRVFSEFVEIGREGMFLSVLRL